MAQTQEYFKKLSDESLAWAIRDIQEAMELNYTGETYAKYSDQLSEAIKERNARAANKHRCPHCGK